MTDIDKKVVDANIKFLYCTEFLINKSNAPSSVSLFREKIEKKGDCMLVIDDDDVVKVHIHTNNPGFVLEQAVKIGEMESIKIDNMKKRFLLLFVMVLMFLDLYRKHG